MGRSELDSPAGVVIATDPIGALWRARAGVGAVFFLNGFGYGSWVPRLAEIKTSLAISEGQLGLALFMAAVGALFAMPLTGALAGRHGSRAATAVTVALYGVALPGLALAPGLVGLGLALLALGAASGALDVSMNAQGVAVEKRYRRPIMSSLHGMFSLGAMAGAGATGLLAGTGLFPHFLAVGALVVVAGLLACRPMLPSSDEEGAKGPGFVRPRASVLLPGIVALCALLSEGAIGDWSAVYLSGSLGAGTTLAATAFAAFSLAMAVGRFAGDRLVARVGGDVVVRMGGALAAAGLAVTLLAGHPVVAVMGFAMVGAGLSCTFPVVLSAAARSPEMAPSAAIAAVCTLGYLGFLVGPPAIGGLAELIGLPAALGLVVLLCALIAALGSREPDRRTNAAVPTSS